MTEARFLLTLRRAQEDVARHARWRQPPSPSFASLGTGRYARVHWRRAAWGRFWLRLRARENWHKVVQRWQASWWQSAMWLMLAANRNVTMVAGRLQ